MKLRLLLLSSILLFACAETTRVPENETDFKRIDGEIGILPLGDSRVQGNRPFHESYRYELWKLLVESEADIDFVGPQTDPGNYPEFMGRQFDMDHGGIGGDQTDDVLGRLNEALYSTGRVPNYVLLGIGGNDLLDEDPVAGIISNMGLIIDQIREENPDVTIILEQIAPGRSDINSVALLGAFNAFNAEVLNLANSKSTAQSNVLVIDMFSGWTDDYMADAVHYNEAGAREVANRYFAVLDTLINP